MKYLAFLFTVLASVGFFNPHAIFSEQIQKLLFYMGIAGSFGIALLEGVSLRGVKYPRNAYIVLLAGILISVVPATAFHMQSLKVSLVATLPFIFAYSFFFILMKLDISEKKIMNTYLILCGISCFVYVCNVLTFPNNIFGDPIINQDESRGIIRIPVVFIEFFPMIVFYAINQWFLDKKKYWWVVMAIAGLFIILSVIRQIIALTAVLGLFFLMRKVSWKIKVLMGAGVVAVVLFVLPMIPMYQTMIEFSEQQHEENEDVENIRITSWRYYTYENQANALTPLIGNGTPSLGNSRWGTQFDSETQDNGCFGADVGWAGFFWQFGIFATLALFIMLLKAAMKKKPESQQYLTYWLIFVMITSVASGPPLYYWQVIDIMVCLYLVYRKDDNQVIEKAIPELVTESAYISDSRKQFPQLKRKNA